MTTTGPEADEHCAEERRARLVPQKSAYELFEEREEEERKQRLRDAEQLKQEELARLAREAEYVKSEAMRIRAEELDAKGLGPAVDIELAIRTAVLRTVHEHRKPYPVPEHMFLPEVRAATPHVSPDDEQIESTVRTMIEKRQLLRSYAHTRGDEEIYVGALYAREFFDFDGWERRLKWPEEYAFRAARITAAAAAAALGAAQAASEAAHSCQAALDWAIESIKREREAERLAKLEAERERERHRLERLEAEYAAVRRQWAEAACEYEAGSQSRQAVLDAEKWMVVTHAEDTQMQSLPYNRVLPAELKMPFYKAMRGWGCTPRETAGMLRVLYYYGNVAVQKPGWALKGDPQRLTQQAAALAEELETVLLKAKNRFYSREDQRAMLEDDGRFGSRIRRLHADFEYVGKVAYCRPPDDEKAKLLQAIEACDATLAEIVACSPSD